MYFTPLASGGGSATYFFVSRSLGGGPEALFLIFPHWDLSRTRVNLVCRNKFVQEAGVVFGKHAEVADTVFQVGYSLYAHTEGITCVFVTVDAAGFEHVRVDHTATEDFDPAGVFAEATTFATADVAGNVHCGPGFGDREGAWA